MKRGPDSRPSPVSLRRAGTITTVRKQLLRGHAVSQACQAGLKTRTHAGEAVPCCCCICEPKSYGRFGNDD